MSRKKILVKFENRFHQRATYTYAPRYLKFTKLTEKPAEKAKKKSFKEQYVAFLIAFGVIGIAIGFVIGQAVNKLVTAIVKDIVSPTIGLFLPGNLDNMSATVTGIYGHPLEFKYGDLISNIIDFAIIVLLVFLAYKVLARYKLIEDKSKPEEKKPEEKKPEEKAKPEKK